MKKICLVLAIMLTLGISVNAEEGYTPGVNSYTNSMTNGVKTVIIYKGSDSNAVSSEDIYYIEQTDEVGGFSNLEMLLKRDAPAGEYTMAVEGGATAKFTISDAHAYVSGGTEVEFLDAQLQSDSTDYSVAFGIRTSVLFENASLTMVIGDKSYTTDLIGENSIIEWRNTEVYTDEDGKAMFAVQINNVPAGNISTNEDGTVIPNFKLYTK